jgi:TetR/AcrR family transcriptional repressor of nem operon
MELSTQDEIIRLKVRSIFEDGVSLFEGALQDAVDSGDLPKIDISLATHALQAYLEGVLLLAKTWNDPEMIRRLSQSALLLARTGAP